MRVSSLVVVLGLVSLVLGCSTDEDCNLNGRCIDKVCKCDPGWTLETCSWIKFKPAKLNAGYRNSTAASWGGSVFQGRDGLYHLYVSQMTNMCGLNEWTTNSEIIRATSRHIEGPYVFQEEILTPWAHNSQPHKAPDGTYLIYHIGNGKYPPWGPPENCSNMDIDLMKKRFSPKRRYKRRSATANTVPVHYVYSHSATGPWKPNAKVTGEDPCDNPTAYFFPNGSVILLYRMDIWANTTPYSEIHMATAPSWKGPYITQSPINTGGPIFQRQGEDPFIYRDARGNFHALFHDMEAGFPYQTTWSGSHAYSRDGLHWTWTPLPAYTSVVTYENGWIARYARRERPQLIFRNDKRRGERRFLTNGIQVTESDDMTFTLIQEIDLS